MNITDNSRDIKGSVMYLDEKVKRTYINELYFLQKQIDFLQKFRDTSGTPSLERTIETLRNSQDKLYGVLVQHGVTAEDIHRVIVENNDEKLVAELLKLQNAKDKISKKLSNAQNLSSKQIQHLEEFFEQKTEEHMAKWGEIINRPNKKRLIDRIERVQKKQLSKETPEQEKQRDFEHM
jgi:hypothetical protein